MSEYVIRVDGNDERWHYVEQQYTHFFGYPITEEIVRCRDCEHYDGNDAGCSYFVLESNKLLHINQPDGFCAWGERCDGRA